MGEIKALSNVSFQLNEGDRLGLVGLNGSGKSTLLKILSGIVKPSSGKVELYRQVQNLSGFDSLLQPDLTGRENAVFHLKLNGFKNSEILPNINEILDFSELGTFFELPVKSYSSGMLLRLSFSIFKILKPEILLLDEVFSAGDMRFQKKAEVFFKEYFNKLSGLILASHQLSEIAEYCNKCLVLNKGEVEFLGSVEEAVNIYVSLNKPKSEEIVENEAMRFLSIDFVSKIDTFYYSENIELEIKYELKQLLVVDVVLYISTSFSNVLTDCEIYRENFTPQAMVVGTISKLINIPNYLLNKGTYYVSLAFGDGQKDILYLKHIASFNIIPDRWEEKRLWNNNPTYPIRQRVEWQTRFSNEHLK